MIDIKQFNLHSGFGGVGSIGRVEGSFTIPAQTVPNASYYSHSVQWFSFDNANNIAMTQIQVSNLSNNWFSAPGTITFDTSNNFYLRNNSYSVTNSTAKFALITWVVQESDRVGIICSLFDRNSGAGSVSVPALSINVRLYLFDLQKA